MSNRVYIQQETTIVHKTKQTTKTVSVFDDFGQGRICLDDYRKSFYEDDMELLLFVLKAVKTSGLENVHVILSSVFEAEKGIDIENTWYEWEQIKPVFEKAGY